MCEEDRETEGDEDWQPYWPTSSSSSSSWSFHVVLSLRHYIFASSGSWRKATVDRSPQRMPGGPSTWQRVLRRNTPDWKQTPASLALSTVRRVYIISQRSCIPVVTNMCFRLFTQVRAAITLFTHLECQALSKVNMQHLSQGVYLMHQDSNPVNPELGTIPSGTIWIIQYRLLNLNNPGQVLNANKFHRAIFFKIKTNNRSH